MRFIFFNDRFYNNSYRFGPSFSIEVPPDACMLESYYDEQEEIIERKALLEEWPDIAILLSEETTELSQEESSIAEKLKMAMEGYCYDDVAKCAPHLENGITHVILPNGYHCAIAASCSGNLAKRGIIRYMIYIADPTGSIAADFLVRWKISDGAAIDNITGMLEKPIVKDLLNSIQWDGQSIFD